MFGKKKEKNPDNRVGLGKLTLWETSSISVALNTLAMSYLVFYCTDSLQLNPALVGSLFVGAKVIDAITDALIGFIIDKTNTRWGKGRPYEIVIIFLWLSTWMMFSTPMAFSTTAKCIWLFCTYTFANAVCKTCVNGNNLPYLVRAFKTKEQQVKVTSYGGFYTMAAAVVFNVSFPMLMSRIAISPEGWSKLLALYGLPLGIVGMLRMLTIKEQYNQEADVRQAQDPLKLSDILTLLKTNKYVVVLTAICFISSTIANMGVGVYYWQYIVGSTALMGVTSVFTIIGLPMAFAFPRWHRKYGIAKTFMVGFFISGLALLGLWFAGASVPMLIFFSVINAFGTVPYNMLRPVLMIEMSDYNEYIGKPRMEATIGSVTGLAEKIGGAIGGFLTGILLNLVNYDGALTTQSDAALLMIRVLFSIVPFICFMIMTFMMRKFGELDQMKGEITETLQKRREEIRNNA